MTIRAVEDRVIVKPDAVEETTSTGLFLPDQSKKEPTTGVVVSTGDRVKDVKEGHHVIFGDQAGSRVTHEGEEFFIMHDFEIIGVLA